ncbi:hypothetical protein [Nocardia beijingensis]
MLFAQLLERRVVAFLRPLQCRGRLGRGVGLLRGESLQIDAQFGKVDGRRSGVAGLPCAAGGLPDVERVLDGVLGREEGDDPRALVALDVHKLRAASAFTGRSLLAGRPRRESFGLPGREFVGDRHPDDPPTYGAGRVDVHGGVRIHPVRVRVMIQMRLGVGEKLGEHQFHCPDLLIGQPRMFFLQSLRQRVSRRADSGLVSGSVIDRRGQKLCRSVVAHSLWIAAFSPRLRTRWPGGPFDLAWRPIEVPCDAGMAALTGGIGKADVQCRIGDFRGHLDIALPPLDRRGDGIRDVADVVRVPAGQQRGDLAADEICLRVVAMVDTADTQAL